MGVKLRNVKGGSIELVSDTNTTTDEVVVISKDKVHIESPDGSKWVITVDNSGKIKTTKVTT